jgi:phosphate-selective porin OprO/OprP
MKTLKLLAMTALFWARITTFKADAQDTNTIEVIKQLQRRIEELEQKVKALEHPQPSAVEENAKKRVEELDKKVKEMEQTQAQDKEEAAAREKAAPSVSMTEEGIASFRFSTPEKDFQLRLGGYVQADARFYIGDNIPINDTFLIRRLRPVMEGTFFKDYDYKILLDIASHASITAGNNSFLQDAFVNAHYWPEFQIQVGKFKPPIGYEHLVSDANLMLVERDYPSELVPNREVGIQFHGELFDKHLDYAVGAFNGVSDGGSEDFDVADDHKDVVGRVSFHPFKASENDFIKGLSFGAGASIGNQNGPLPSFVTTAQQRFFSYASGAGTSNSPNVVADGGHWRVAPELQYTFKSFGIFGEYVVSSQEIQRNAGSEIDRATIANQAWNVTASYILTGEQNTLRGVSPEHPLALHGGGWGAWEIVGRVGELRIDDDVFPLYAAPGSARSALSFGVGLNWYLNRNLKLNLNYEQTHFQGGSLEPGSVTAQDERAFMTRVQFGF